MNERSPRMAVMATKRNLGGNHGAEEWSGYPLGGEPSRAPPVADPLARTPQLERATERGRPR